MRFAFNPFTRALDCVDIGSSGAGPIDTLTGNSGGAVGADAASNVNILGSGVITVTGNPGTNTLTITTSAPTITTTQYDVLVGGTGNTIVSVGPGSAGQLFQSSGAGVNPAYTTATYPSTTTINQILYSSANNVIGGITAANNGTLISGTTGVPSWLANGTTGMVLTATTGSPPSWVSPAGGGLPSSVQGDTFYASGVNTVTTLAKDTNATRYLSNTGTSNNPAWAQVALGTGVSGQLPLANGGTNANLTASNGGIFYSTATAGAILAGTATAGQILRSGSSTTPAWSTATYPATAGTSGNVLTSDGTNWSSSAPITNVSTTNFTPVLNFGGATTGITYTTQLGRYARVGSIVTFSIEILLSSKGSATGVATITGLPVTSTATIIESFTPGLWSNITPTALYTNVGAFLAGGSTTLNIIITGSGQTYQNAADTMFANNSYLIINGSYLV